LAAEEVRKWLFNNRIIKDSDAVPYSMPSLTDDIGDIQRRAYEEGFASGERAGFSEGEQKCEILLERIEKIISEVTSFKSGFVVEVEKQVVDLSVAIAGRIIMEEINMKPEIIVTMVKEALKRLQRVGNIRIKINPTLHELFMKKKPELLEVHEDITFDVDATVPVTGPLVISEIEEVVTDIDSLIENIVDEMKSTEVTNLQAGEQNTEDKNLTEE
jgi:flagellar assembly protein FliH